MTQLIKVVFLALFISICCVFNAQTIDELKANIESASGLKKSQYQIQLAQKLLKSDPAAALTSAQEGISNASGNEQLLGGGNAIAAKAALALKEYDNAISYGQQACDIYGSGDAKNFAISSSTIGDAYTKKGNQSKAIEYYSTAYESYKSIGNNKFAGYKASAIGSSYNNKGDVKNAIAWFEKSADQFTKAGMQKDVVQSYQTIGALYSNYGDYESATTALINAKDIAKKNDLNDKVAAIDETLTKVDKNASVKGNTSEFEKEQNAAQEAYISNVQAQAAKSLAEIENMSEEMQLAELKLKAQKDEANILALENLQLSLEKDKLASETALAKAEKDKADAEKLKAEAEATAQAANQNILFLVIGALVLVAGAILFGLMKTKKLNASLKAKNDEILKQNKEILKQKEEITEQKDEIVKQSQNIDESIAYATRIQKALLPSAGSFVEKTKNSFVFLRPKDKVSGDFFWYHQNGNKLITVAADCTGHGVPGAFMSIIFSTILDKIVIDNKITQPDKILEDVCNALKMKLKDREVNDQEFKDGMDVAITCFDKESNKIQYSGARNPIYVVRDGELMELKGTRRSVGVNNPRGKDFELVEQEGKAGDKIFMFSDGFPDQKGGPKGKKFYYAPFKDLLAGFDSTNFKEGEELLQKKYEEWKGDKEQFDDVMVIGMEI